MSRSHLWAAAWLVAILCLAVRRLLVIVTVHGNSMRPTYAAGDTLLGLRSRRLGRGRPVVFRPPSATTDPTGPPYRVKRIIALAGDPTPEWVGGGAAGKPVPAGCLVVRGDFQGSEDSRHYGYVREHDVLAVIVGRIRSTNS